MSADRNQALEEAARACEDMVLEFLSTAYAGNDPMSSFAERFACAQCADRIRGLKESQPVER